MGYPLPGRISGKIKPDIRSTPKSISLVLKFVEIGSRYVGVGKVLICLAKKNPDMTDPDRYLALVGYFSKEME